jgi:PIN domain nuclease of toxin-antitoxin system
VEASYVTHLDTHVVLWLWLKDTRRLRPFAKELERDDLAYSPIVALELALLHEIGRLRPYGDEVLAGLADTIGLTRSSADFGRVAEVAMTLSWTRDPFDRLIVATAAVDSAKLLTSDSMIRRHFARARR